MISKHNEKNIYGVCMFSLCMSGYVPFGFFQRSKNLTVGLTCLSKVGKESTLLFA